MSEAGITGQSGSGSGGSGGSNASVGLTGANAPSSATEIGIVDGAGKLQAASATNPIPITGSISATNPSVGTIGATAPTSATFLGVLDGTGNIRGVGLSNPVRIDPTGTTVQPVSGTITANQGGAPWSVTLASTTITGTVAVTQNTPPWLIAGDSASGATKAGNPVQIGGVFNTTQPTVTTGQTVEAQSTARGAQIVAVGVDGFAVTLVSTTVTGTVAVTQSTTPWLVSGDSASGASKAGNPVQIGGVFNTAQPTVTTGQTVEAQATARGGLIVSTGVDTFNVTINAALPAGTAVIGHIISDSGSTTAVTQATASNLNATISIAAAQTLATVTTVTAVTAITNALPTGTNTIGKVDILGNAAAILDGVNTAATAPANGLLILGIFNTTLPTLTTGQSAGIQVDSRGQVMTDTNFVLGALMSVTNPLFSSITDGTTKAGVIVGTTALKTDMSSVAGTATTTAAAGTQKVGIVGNTAAALDAVITAATAPTNALAVLAVQNTTAPSLTTGQSVALQCDYQGSQFVKPYRRAQTVSKQTHIAASVAATTILAAQAAGIFADISTLILTVAPIATTAIDFTATLGDGTNTYIYNMNTGVTGTGTINQLVATFNPPLPATSPATAWTITLSSAAVLLFDITCVAVLQKAG